MASTTAHAGRGGIAGLAVWIGVVCAGLCAGAEAMCAGELAPVPAWAAGHEAVVAEARALAARPYEPPPPLPGPLGALGYDAYRDIRFRPDRAIGHVEGWPFEVQLFHLGGLFAQPVQVRVLDRGGAGGTGREVAFDPGLFAYGRQADSLEPTLRSLDGFAGLRVHYHLNSQDYRDELVAFLGASYFRALAAGQVYGLSARGVAVNPGGDEQFPAWREFEIEPPAKDARELRLHAVLDGESVTGAYTFVIRPGEETVMDVCATLFVRSGAHIDVLGVAPLTSMFWHGENSPVGAASGDFRPEIHDSDGLVLRTRSGDSTWRVLDNPGSARTSEIVGTTPGDAPVGYGLVQRDRDFADYQDLEAHYEQRPSCWVEPLGGWPAGELRLLELHTPNETQDNIVAYWAPVQVPAAGQPWRVTYRLRWCTEGRSGPAPAPGWVHATRRGDFVLNHPDHHQLVIEFDAASFPAPGASLDGAGGGPPLPRADVRVGEGARLAGSLVQANEHAGTWRLTLDLIADGGGRGVPLTASLVWPGGDGAVHAARRSEMWTCLWSP